jgi:WD40 repeat protein
VEFNDRKMLSSSLKGIQSFCFYISRRGIAAITSVSMTPDGRYMVVGRDDAYIYLYNKKGDILWDYETSSCIISVSITSDGNYIVVGGSDGTTCLFSNDPKFLDAQPKVIYLGKSMKKHILSR